jgi:hypothetical protein
LEEISMLNVRSILACAALALGAPLASAQGFNSGIPAGWTCVGNCGTLGADGVVTLAPGGGTAYGWVATGSNATEVSPFGLEGKGLGGETDGSVLRSAAFSALGGDPLQFSFNYVTSDGSGYADYAWARVLNASDSSQVALLFTARTQPSGSIIPGFGLPSPDATVSPNNVPIIGGGPLWSPLNGSSGACWDAGCGYTGWVTSNYSFAGAGSYVLEFGVTNWDDTAYQSGMAFDGITVAGKPITPAVPEPETYALMLAGLAVVGALARRRRGR